MQFNHHNDIDNDNTDNETTPNGNPLRHGYDEQINISRLHTSSDYVDNIDKVDMFQSANDKIFQEDAGSFQWLIVQIYKYSVSVSKLIC